MATPCCDLCHGAKVTGEPSTCRNQDCWGCKHTREEAEAIGPRPPPSQAPVVFSFTPPLPPRDVSVPLITKDGTNIEAPADAAWGHHAYLYAWHWYRAAGDGSADGVDMLTTSNADEAWLIIRDAKGLNEGDRQYLKCSYATTVESWLAQRRWFEQHEHELQLEHDAHLSVARQMSVWLHEALGYAERLLGLTGAQGFGFGQRLFNIKVHLLHDPRTEKKP